MALIRNNATIVLNNITFDYLEEKITITREDGYCDITQLRKRESNKDMSDFKKTQKKYITKLREELKVEPIISEGNNKANTTKIHERILERVFRFYEVPESIIDKFVKNDCREIGVYEFKSESKNINSVVHLESGYVNISHFAPQFGKQGWRWPELKTVKKLLNHYSNEKGIDEKEIIKRGLGYDSKDIWVPYGLLPMVAIWCSPRYAVFVSDIMTLYHNDPMKLASVAIKEHDRQNDTHTVAIMQSFDRKEDYDKLIAQLQQENKTLKIKNDNLFVNSRRMLQYDNLRTFMNENNLTHENVDMLVKNRSKMIKVYTDPLNQTIIDQKERIEKLNREINETNQSKDELYEKKIVEIEKKLTDKIIERDHRITDLEAELRMWHVESKRSKGKSSTKRLLKKSTLLSGKNRSRFTDLSLTGLNFENNRTNLKLVSIQPDDDFINRSNHSIIYMYTFINYEQCITQVVMTPGPSRNAIQCNYNFRGVIHLSNDKKVLDYLNEFSNNKKVLISKHIKYTFALSKSCNSIRFEKSFTKYFNNNIISKETAYGHSLIKDRNNVWDTLCSY